MPEHLFVQRSCPPFDHAAFVHQTAAKLGEGPAFWKNLTANHGVQCDTKSLPLLDQDLNMAGNTGIHEFIADFADVGRQQLTVARKEALVPLVDDQVKIIDLNRITVPVFPE